MMISGQIIISDDGTENFIPNDTTNAAKALYNLLLADQSNITTPSTSITPPVVTLNPITLQPTITDAIINTSNIPVYKDPSNIPADAKKAQAKLAMTMATWMVTYLQTNAMITGQVITSTDGTIPLNNGKIT